LAFCAPTSDPAFALGAEEAALYDRHPSFGLKLKPHVIETFGFGTHVRTNALGLRDHPDAAKRPWEFRILSVGDSYAFCYRVELEQSYAKVLEHRLNQECPGRMFSVINVGVPGYGTQQQQTGVPAPSPDTAPGLCPSHLAEPSPVKRHLNALGGQPAHPPPFHQRPVARDMALPHRGEEAAMRRRLRVPPHRGGEVEYEHGWPGALSLPIPPAMPSSTSNL
jgi:hypothetical protein